MCSDPFVRPQSLLRHARRACESREQNVTTRSLKPIIALILGGIVVALCCVFVDQPLAWYVHEHRFYSDDFRLWPMIVSGWLTWLAVPGIVAVVAWRWWRLGGQVQTLLLAIVANLIATEGIKSVLKWAFGRNGPWFGNNSSWIADGVYGFHPFAVGGGRSFPSGHAAATFAVISILWLSRPQWRWLYAVVGGLVCVAMVGLNYHYAGDVIAGAMLGSVTGVYAARLFRLEARRKIDLQPVGIDRNGERAAKR
jgi:membrane-associated phospholipid phosphatase